MRHLTPACLLLVASSLTAAETRPLRVEDLYALKDVRDPRPAPAGGGSAFAVASLAAKKDKGDTALYMVPFAGGDAMRLTGGDKPERRPRFSPDGRYIAFVSGREGQYAVVYLMLARA